MNRLTPAFCLVALLCGCVNSVTKDGITFVRSSSIFEPGATVVLKDREVISVIGGPSGASQLAGPAGEVGAAVVRRPNRTNVTVENFNDGNGPIGGGNGDND